MARAHETTGEVQLAQAPPSSANGKRPLANAPGSLPEENSQRQIPNEQVALTSDQKAKAAAAIVARYEKQLKGWDRFAILSLGFKALCIYAAGLCGALAAVFASDKTMVQVFGVGAAASALASAVVDRLGTPKVWRDAWRTLGTSIAEYQIGELAINELIKRHDAAERMIAIMVVEKSETAPLSLPAGR